MNTSLTNVLLPEPDTPVTSTIFPSGNFTLIFFRLCSDTPFSSTNLPLPLRRVSGIGMTFLPDKYCPVMEFGEFLTSSGVPFAMTSPPWIPAPGPISTIQSECNIVSSSCSTIMSELPRSRIF